MGLALAFGIRDEPLERGAKQAKFGGKTDLFQESLKSEHS